jgi:hypothetical protein
MDKQQERELHKAIDSVLSDNLSPVVSKPGIIGLRGVWCSWSANHACD